MPCLYSMILEYSRRVDQARRDGNGHGIDVRLYRALNTQPRPHRDDTNDTNDTNDDGIPRPPSPNMHVDASSPSSARQTHPQDQSPRVPVKRGRRSRPKVKTGCSNCKQRRIKCDEARPACSQCVRSSKECTGYPPPPRSLRPDHEVRIAPRPARPLAAASAASASTSASASAGPPPPPPRQPPPPPALAPQTPHPVHAPSPAPTPAEASYFRTFVEQTASELSGFFDSPFYNDRVLDASHTEPAIRHAATALGALYKTLERPPSPPPGAGAAAGDQARHWQVAFKQYSEACHAMLALRDPSHDSLRTQLMASVLLASFDSFIGDYRQAIVQIQSGLELHERIRRAERLPAYGVATEAVEEELTIIFMRLAIQAKSYDLAFHFPQPYVVRFVSPAAHQAHLHTVAHHHHQHPPPPPPPPPSPPLPHQQQQQQHHHHHHHQQHADDMDSYSAPSRILPPEDASSPAPAASPRTPVLPHAFASLREARIAHDRLNERIIRFQESLAIRPKEAYHTSAPSQWLAVVSSFKQQLASWARAYEPILAARAAPRVGRRERAGIAALQMAHLNAIVISAIQFNNTEMVFDAYLPVFRSIVDMGLEIVSEQERRGADRCRDDNGPECPHRDRRRAAPAPSHDAPDARALAPLHIEPTFSMDLGIVAPLYVVATKCREPVLRRKAIELLAGSARREGMWDSELTARVGRWVMLLEEGHPDAVAGGHVHGVPDLGTGGLGQQQRSPGPAGADKGALITVPEERRLTVKALDFDLRARVATVCVGARGVPDGVADPRARQTRITW